MFMHSSKRFFVGEPVKKLFSVALLLWRECVYVVSKIWSINRWHLSQSSICLDKALGDEVRRVITGVERPDSLACVAAWGWTWTEIHSTAKPALCWQRWNLVWSGPAFCFLLCRSDILVLFLHTKIYIAALPEVNWYWSILYGNQVLEWLFALFPTVPVTAARCAFKTIAPHWRTVL